MKKQAEFRKGKNNCASDISLFVALAGEAHPRHSPRAFPLWLLAPRFLGAVLFLAFPACSRVLGHRLLLGRGRNPLPSFGLLLAVSVGVCSDYRFYIFFEFSDFVFYAFGVRPRTTPLHIFILDFSVSLSLLISVTSITTALIFSHAIAEMPEDSNLCV